MAAMDIEMVSPVGPMVGMNFDQSHQYGIQAYQPEVDLCQLLQAMSLTKGKFKVPEPETYVPYASQSPNGHGVNMAPAYHSDVSASSSSNSNSSDHPPPYQQQAQQQQQPAAPPAPPSNHPLCPEPTPSERITTTIPTSHLPACHFLQSILASIAPSSPVLSPSPYPYPVASPLETTNGAYLETLLVHRSLLSAFPAAHLGCATALNEIARAVEVRAWHAGRDEDAEAVAALRQEAFIVSTWV